VGRAPWDWQEGQKFLTQPFLAECASANNPISCHRPVASPQSLVATLNLSSVKLWTAKLHRLHGTSEALTRALLATDD